MDDVGHIRRPRSPAPFVRPGRRHAASMLVMLVLSLVLALTSTAQAGPTKSTRAQSSDLASVIVRARPGAEHQARAAVARLGGTIGMRLSIVNGFAAKLPEARVQELRSSPAILGVTPNRVVRSLGADYSGVDVATDIGAMANVVTLTGARAYWAAGFTGTGVGVALIDTGVSTVDGLSTKGKVINGPDLSFDSQNSKTRYIDGFGHGTHLAGIIAGRATGARRAYATDFRNFLGMAPDASVVNVKVGDKEGVTDVSQVIAAIDWVVQHRDDKGLNIRVLNLSYGTDTAQPYTDDPLAYAAEQAWKAGIFVVTAAGNAGFSLGGTLVNPAYDPLLMAVGATDMNGTFITSDDTVASFSSTGLTGNTTGSGSGSRAVDVLAPGSHIVSLRVPGSHADVNYGSTGLVNSTLFRGSGTSQAAAVVSGAAALVLQQRPAITPDQLKALFKATATRVSGDTLATGSGQINVAAALLSRTPSASPLTTSSTGTGSLELSRGSLHVVANGVVLEGEQDIFGMPFDSGAMAILEAAQSSWSGGMWNGSSWSGSSWSGSSWSSSSWSGSSWSGSSWSGSSWSSSSWSTAGWLGASWG